MKRYCLAVALAAGAFLPCTAIPAQAAAFEGTSLTWPWALPFAGILLSIATGPLLFPRIWHRHYGKIATGWALLALIPIASVYGVPAAFAAFVHAIVAEYLSFIILLFALYTVAGGILVTGRSARHAHGQYDGILALGTGIASIRRHHRRGHDPDPATSARECRGARATSMSVIFFIILVANIGGALTPLGDPPLFVGFLRGVDFFWTARNIWLQTLIVRYPCCARAVRRGRYLVLSRRDAAGRNARRNVRHEIRIRGRINFVLIALIVADILLIGDLEAGRELRYIRNTGDVAKPLARRRHLIGIALLSLWLTPNEHRGRERVYLGADPRSGDPVRGDLSPPSSRYWRCCRRARGGPFAILLTAVTAGDGLPNEAAYFWLTGILSAFLDNAPTYLVFFELAGGDANEADGPARRHTLRRSRWARSIWARSPISGTRPIS